MIKNIIDNRNYKIGPCDAVIELDGIELEDYSILHDFESEEVDYILDIANNIKSDVSVFIYDLNSKPLK